MLVHIYVRIRHVRVFQYYTFLRIRELGFFVLLFIFHETRNPGKLLEIISSIICSEWFIRIGITRGHVGSLSCFFDIEYIFR